MRKVLFWSALATLLLSTLPVHSQKKPLGADDILKWNRITEQRISNNGTIVVYKQEPWKGDPTLFIKNADGQELGVFACATRSAITQDSKQVVFVIKPAAETVRQLKLKKTKKDDMPKDQLGIFHLETGKTDTLKNLKAYELPAEWAGYMAFQTEKVKTAKNEESEEKEKEESDKNGRTLQLLSFETGDTLLLPFVTEFHFASKGKVLIFVSTGDDKDFDAGLYVLNVGESLPSLIFRGKADFKQLTINETGDQIGFLADPREEKERKKKSIYGLYHSENHHEAKMLAGSDDLSIPQGMEISPNGRLQFSPSGNRLFFGIAPIPPEKDTTILAEEQPVVDIWHWNEPELYTQQLKTRSRDMRKTYQAVYHRDLEKLVVLQDKNLQRIILIQEGDNDLAIGTSNLPYAVEGMWEGSPYRQDIYVINILNGTKERIKQNVRISPQVSPGGKYMYWYHPMDTTWTTRNLKTGKEKCIITPDLIQTANELNDIPNPPGSYGSPGWLADDEALLVYDRYNIWKVDPDNQQQPKNLTGADPKDGMSYRMIAFDRRKIGREGWDPKEDLILAGHNEITREDGLFSWSLKSKKAPKELLYGPFSLSQRNFQKAKDTDLVLFTKEDFKTFPDLLISDLKFKKPVKISDANPQQKDFIWGTAELVSWTSLDGRKLEGLLCKPENFDPNKKYPMIVNFYEKSSQGLYSYRMPERHRSTIDYHYYTSHGYLVFNPDVYYKTGYPGEDAFNCVMPGITHLIAQGYVDEKAIGAQGHSWGGYQVAYLATRTQLFAAIESGAPVVNMFSAYGGIRWGSGMNRSFQYEHTQSRIGKSIWEAPLRYLENSPLFTLDKVTTPILIMHNDDDGAVPWYQGIEFFIGLRRLGKPAWLLNYNNADHWPTRLEDKHDFQIRLAQFFDHYLKGAPMPEWMEKGVPAIEKGINPGY